MKRPPKLSINIVQEFRFTTEKRQAHKIGYDWTVEVATPTETPSSVAKVLRDIFVATRAWFLKSRGLFRFKPVLDEPRGEENQRRDVGGRSAIFGVGPAVFLYLRGEAGFAGRPMGLTCVILLLLSCIWLLVRCSGLYSAST
ncbi:hypothetical protein DER44DRAFT_783430 [Fusarium oxysporum]|nr:hypothetical protein DER44DRAFT_783430 [Fusarium oxysporum]